MSLSTPVLLHPTTPRPAIVAGALLAVGGFLLLAAAVASGATPGIWPSTLIVAAGVPLRHSLEDDVEAGEHVVRRHPTLLALAVVMATTGALLGVLLSD
ncbi:hypothetical protein [Nocardioides sp. KR10-350]|uniref:hypothetical protein n=1 Tax=Nocardioides cheoyonin TaxID=3156615 RepID=UPI0032B34F4E